MSSEEGGQEIDLTRLTLAQLSQLKQQFEGDLSVYHDSLQNLKMVQTKFQSSNEICAQINKSCEDKEILVPLTGSMYVPGKLTNTDKLLIDIGTGYYVETNPEKAVEYLKKKVDFITDNMRKIQILGEDKSKVHNAIVEVMNIKIKAQISAQAQALYGPK